MELVTTAIFSFITGALIAIFAEPFRRELFKPCLNLDFDGKIEDYVSETPERNQATGAKNRAYYIKIKVSNTKRLAKSCVGYLTNIERFSEKSKKWERTKYSDAIPLPWACLGVKEINLGKEAYCFLDVFSTRDNSNEFRPEVKGIPYRYEEIPKHPGKYRFTVRVYSENADPGEIKICLEWNGRWDAFKVRKDTGRLL